MLLEGVSVTGLGPSGPGEGDPGNLCRIRNQARRSMLPLTREAAMQEKLSPVQVLLSAFALSSFGGLAALLRSHRPLSWRLVFAATLYSGLLGLIIALVWYNQFEGAENMYFLLGISGLAGIGGTTVLDFVLQLLKGGGLNITIGPKKPDEADAKDLPTGKDGKE